MHELQAGVWHWQAAHPDWKPSEGWDEMVSSYAVDTGDRLLLFDPLGLPSEIEEHATGRETAIVLTCTWHARDAEKLVDRLGAHLYAPPPEEGRSLPATVFAAGERLSVGIEAFRGFEPNDLVLWVESRRVVVAGDTLIDRGNGLELPRDWLAEGVSADEILEALRPLLDLPVELVLATHGGPTDRAALERALA